jgi:5-methylcytosine-specific restriction protein A
MAWARGQTRSSTAAHKAWARAVLAAAKGRCQIQGPRCSGVAVLADHITPVGEGGAEHDVRNGQGACQPCHDEKTARETARGRSRYYGKAKYPKEQRPQRPRPKERGAWTPSHPRERLRNVLLLGLRALLDNPFLGAKSGR